MTTFWLPVLYWFTDNLLVRGLLLLAPLLTTWCFQCIESRRKLSHHTVGFPLYKATWQYTKTLLDTLTHLDTHKQITKTHIQVNPDIHIRPCHTLRWNGSFSCDFELLEASQTIADYPMCILKNRSSVASLLLTMESFHILLRWSLLRWYLEIFNLAFWVTYHLKTC